MRVKHFINRHKGAAFAFVLGLMMAYQNFTFGPWIYLSLHGTYGFLWLFKDRIYPDKQWEQEVSLPTGLLGFEVISLYWIAPFILISSRAEPATPLVAAAVAICVLGVFLHFSSDAPRYYTLKYNPGLISEGFFARCRNTNYLGEILICFAFSMLTSSWIPFAILGGFIAGVFIPNMLRKDKSLGRYPDFQTYKACSGLLIPKLTKPPT